MAESLKALFLLYIKPGAAMGRILDRGRLWFAVVAAIATSLALHSTDLPVRAGSAWLRFVAYTPGSWLAPLMILAAALVPAMILVRAISGHGSFNLLIGSDYAPLLMCTLLAWTAAYLPLAVARFFFEYDFLFLPIAFLVVNAYFAILTIFAVRTVYGTGFGAAIGMTLVGWIAGIAGAALVGLIGPLFYLLGSPLVLILLYFAFASRLQSLSAVLRNRQHFQQQLEIATNNPHDADAHYQLGLVYQQRRQLSEAIARFERAVEIDRDFADAHLQLGVIARTQQRFDDAIEHLEVAARLDDKLAQSDVWRELGAAYFEASRVNDALPALQKFTERRAYDPEGLYWYGKALAASGREAEAREMFGRAIEAVNTMPSHRRAQVRQWGSRARSELR